MIDLRQTVRDAIDAMERNSTSAPVVECLKAALAADSDRISELLGFNNEFEERARVAERENKLLRAENEAFANKDQDAVIIQNWFDLYRELNIPEGGSAFDFIMEMKKKLNATLPGKRADDHRAPMALDRIEGMEAHTDEGGQLSHANAIELLQEVLRLRKPELAEAGKWLVCDKCSGLGRLPKFNTPKAEG